MERGKKEMNINEVYSSDLWKLIESKNLSGYWNAYSKTLNSAPETLRDKELACQGNSRKPMYENAAMVYII